MSEPKIGETYRYIRCGIIATDGTVHFEDMAAHDESAVYIVKEVTYRCATMEEVAEIEEAMKNRPQWREVEKGKGKR